ncbi:MAG: hypothetical protein EA396_09660 [Anaerolineaceae bacterium]|nr:MAG: hypothetical protein EA396_09660 [Anaerolineaceae bacterium]
MSDENAPKVNADLLAVLRCPVAVQDKSKGEDPGQLELVRDYWLVCADSGYKYPIRDGIPVMLVEEGERWKDTADEDLPVPPPPAENPVDQI